MPLTLHIATSQTDRAACLALRREVFILEQSVPEHEEVDGEDDRCTHILALDNGKPVGAARFQPKEHYIKIQRVCVLASHRGQGIGADIIRFIADHVANTSEIKTLRLGAQTHALEFYRRLGFIEFGEEYIDAGILHRDMELHIS